MPKAPIECRPSPDAESGVSPVAVPEGVTADFALPGDRPSLVVTPEGDATVLWYHAGALLARSYRSSEWQDVETVVAVDESAPVFGLSPKLVALPDGRRIVAYHESRGGQQVVCVRERSAAGRWSTVTSLAVTGLGEWQDPSPPEYALVADREGNLTALVRASRVSEPLTKPAPVGLLAFRAPVGGPFDGPTLLATGLTTPEFALSVDDRDEALAVWRSPGEGSMEIAAFSPGAGWRSYPRGPLGHDALHALPEADGTTSVLAIRSVSGAHRVQTAKWLGDGRWGPVSDLGGASNVLYNARIVAGGGRALATWWTGGDDCSVSSTVVRRGPGGGWSKAEAIPGAPPSNTRVVSTALSAGGHALIGWAEEHRGPKYCSETATFRLSWITPAGAWAPPAYLDGGKAVGGPTVLLTATGRALVAWSHDDRVLVRWIDPP